jgi:hypothetical protein
MFHPRITVVKSSSHHLSQSEIGSDNPCSQLLSEGKSPAGNRQQANDCNRCSSDRLPRRRLRSSRLTGEVGSGTHKESLDLANSPKLVIASRNWSAKLNLVSGESCASAR